MENQMRLYIGILLLLLAIPHLAFAQTDSLPLVRQAESAYQAGDYPTAIVLYEQLVADGARDGVIYYDLGNAYLHTDDLGQAMLNYRRAQQFIPRDMDLITGLARTRTQRIDLQNDERNFIASAAALTANVLSLTEFSWLVFGLWTSWFVLLLLRMLNFPWQETLRLLSLAVGLLLLVGGILLSSRLYLTYREPAAVIIAPTAPVMSGPGNNYLEHFTVHPGTEIRIVETRPDWLRFVLPDGRQGWITAEVAEKVKPGT
jgi:tetratricopeptide (TPR) repeat protein